MRHLKALGVLVLAALSTGGEAAGAVVARSFDPDMEARHALIESRLAYYQEAFPDTYFVHLAGGADWRGDMVVLYSLLGSGAVNLDYIAPVEANEELLDVNLARIARFLQTNVVSSASFRTGRGALTDRRYLCVVTLNPAVFARDPVEATRQMLDISDRNFEKVHPARLINVSDHMEFVVDHEVFHCLESTRHGGMPLTQEPFGSEYNAFRRESAADSFALAMHLRKHGGRTAYAGNIALIRALWLVTESPDSCTFETVKSVYQRPVDDLVFLSPAELVDYTIRLRDRMVGGYEDYVRQRNATRGAAAILKARSGAGGGGATKVTDRSIGERIDRYHFYLDQLFIDAPVEFAPVDIQRQ